MEYKFINTEYLDSVSAGDNSVIIEIIDMFREQAGEMYNDMKALLAEKNYYTPGTSCPQGKVVGGHNGNGRSGYDAENI